jgi:hypothetical protein
LADSPATLNGEERLNYDWRAREREAAVRLAAAASALDDARASGESRAVLSALVALDEAYRQFDPDEAEATMWSLAGAQGGYVF